MSVLRLAVLGLFVLLPEVALAATVSLAADARSIHVGLPFTLTLTAEGFEEDPAPVTPQLVIDGCTVTYLGMSPSVSTRITIVNGQSTEERDVTFRYRWRVLAPAEGTYQVPSLEIVQGSLVAHTPAASFQAVSVPDTEDMIIRMQLPADGVYEGETFDVAIDWLITRNAENFEIVVPLFDLDGAEVEAVPGTGRTVRFGAGDREVDLPMERGEEVVQGRAYTRFRFSAEVTLSRPGTFDLGPVQALAHLQTGEARDRFGISRPEYGLFRATGQPRHLVVRPLPIAGRPASFVNAIGGGFSIDVQASRTVVSVGEPIELTIRIRGDAALEGLSLPPLGGPEGLPVDQFSAPEGSVAGRIDTETNSKTFVVTVRARSAEAGAIPPIAFSWFDPAAGEYRTTRSQPIALSVEATERVGAADVIAASPAAPVDSGRREDPEAGARMGSATLVGADMSLSEPEETLARSWGTGDDRMVLAALYGGPAIVLLAMWWFARTGGRRERRRAVRAAMRELERALRSPAPARDAAPAIVAGMRRLAGLTGADQASAASALERLETRAFDPRLAQAPIEDDVTEALRSVAREWTREEQASGVSRSLAVCALALAGAGVAGSPAAGTDSAPPAALDEARSLYAQALEETDRERRVGLFEAAERAFRPVAESNPLAPGVQADWGNAALGARDAGRAVLAYRRALRVAPDDARARANLAWVRGQMPAWLPRPESTGSAFDSLFFWRGVLNSGQLHLVAAFAFAVGLLVLAGGLFGARRGLRILAVPALVVWAIAVASALAWRPPAGDAVVVTDGATLRSADSTGAAPALARPLPAGAEVAIVEYRDGWARVRLADGSSGWLILGTVQPVAFDPG